MNLEKRKLFIGYLCAISATIFWGFDTVVIRWLIHDGVNPFLIGDLRLFIGSAVLSLFVIGIGIFRKKNLQAFTSSKFFWIITVSLALNFILFHKGLEFTIASDAVLLEAFAPVMVILITMLFLPKSVEHLLRHPGIPQKILQIVVIGSVGSSLLLINEPTGSFLKPNAKLIGDLIEFAAMGAWALVLLGIHEFQKQSGEQAVLASTANFLFIAGLILAPFVPWKELAGISYTQWLWILGLGVFSTGFAYVLWHKASKYLDLVPLITIFNLVSIFTVLTESIVLDLEITWKLVLGGILILYAAFHAKVINERYKIVKTEETPGE